MQHNNALAGATGLTHWAASQGVDVRSITIANGSRGRGIMATSAINAGELILRIPHALLLTANRVHYGARH